jgi:DNA primase catalytic core
MLSRETIDAVNELSLEQVISKYVELKQQGSSLVGKSPFADEKTGSFHVSRAKNIWKCFSSGKGGNNPISFIMEFQQCTFIEAVKELADQFSIELKYDDSDRAKQYEQKQEKIKEISDINSLALEYFISNIPKIPANKLRATAEMYDKFALGYAPEEFQGLVSFLQGKGISVDQMVRASLATIGKENKPFDFFRGRIMFPIYSYTGKIIGFSGRDIIERSEEDAKKTPKVLNSKETDAYQKSQSMLGLFHSKTDISHMGFACLAEGNFDVTSLHSVGLRNTIAPLGTAFTDDQANLIKRLTDTVCIMADNDKAGLKSIEPRAIKLLEKGFKVMLFIPPGADQDPDDLVQSTQWKEDDFLNMFNEQKLDAVEWLAASYFNGANSTIEKSQAEKHLTNVLTIIPDAQLRNAYVKTFAREYKIEKASVEKSISIELAAKSVKPEEPKGYRLPGHLKAEDHDDWNEFGFFQDPQKQSIGYYFPNASFSFDRVSNFILRPLFQVGAIADSKRIIELENKDKKTIIEVPNKAFSSLQIFEEIVTNEGNFWFNGSKKHFQKLRTKLLAQFPYCQEIRTLGWQNRGFYAFANGIVDGNFRKVDSNGICHYGDEKFFLPAFSDLYKNVQEEDDLYEADRHFVFRPTGITMAEWSKKMVAVHDVNGMWSVLYVIATVYRDFIYSINTNFPLLFNFGLPQTGKSTCARSINAIFFGQQAPFNLSTGTAVSFHRRLAKVKNAIVWFDEYTNDIDEKRFQSLKAAYDGAGHEKGVMSNDNRTVGTKINSAPVISGQFLPTRDGNSLFTRNIILYFTKKPEDRTIEEVKEFNELNEWERNGLSDLIIEIVRFRDYFMDKFPAEQFELVSKIKKDLEGEQFEGRVMQNYALLLTVAKIMSEKLHLSFTFDEVYKAGLKGIVKQSEQISDSNDMNSYWKMIEYLSMQSQIRSGEDYKIETLNHITVREGREKPERITFKKPMKVLLLRFNRIHPLYMEAHRKQFGENGVPEQSIKSYMKTSKQFIGNVAVVNFNGDKTSAFAFYFDELGLSLRVPNEGPTPQPVTEETKPEDLPF